MKKLALLFVFVQTLVFANNPEITLNGDSVVELYLNSYYNDPGATAFDSEDGDLSNSIVVTGTYDSSTMGSYVLAYSVTDSDGNESVKIRTIVVVDEINESYQGTLEYQIYDSNQSGELDSGDDISFKLTSKNTGNVGGDGGQYDYTFLDFNANSISLTSNSFVGGIQLDVGDTNVSYSTYTITEQTLNSGGVELEVNLFFGGYYFKSNKLIVTFETGSSEEIILDGQISANNNQIKKVADPTDAQDAATKAYADAIVASRGLMNFSDWDNYQVWNDNTTVNLTPNSFVFLNADNTTLVLPDNPENCCFGDVIYVYVMRNANSARPTFLKSNNLVIRDRNGNQASSGQSLTGVFQGGGGLQMIINVGDYWMAGSFESIGD